MKPAGRRLPRGGPASPDAGGRKMMARTTWIALAGALVMLVLGGSAARWSVAADDEPEFPHGEFEEDCSLCHSDEGWSPAVISAEFDHAPGRRQGSPASDSASRGWAVAGCQ